MPGNIFIKKLRSYPVSKKKITRHGPKQENDRHPREKTDNRSISIDYLNFRANQQGL